MSLQDRAAQFAPFAALSGHDAAIREAGRLTQSAVELQDDEKELLDTRLRLLQSLLPQQPEVSVCYFRPDERKPGGAYLETTGVLTKIDPAAGILLFADGRRIFLEYLRSIDCPALELIFPDPMLDTFLSDGS